MIKVLVTAAFTLLLQAGPLLACAGCREPGEEVEATTVMAGLGFSWGVIFMLLFLGALCSGLGWFVARTIKAVDAGKSAE